MNDTSNKGFNNMSPKNHIVYSLALVLILISVYLIIESCYPYFFSQDDNRDYFLPYFIYNYRCLLNGELAVFNFHQFLGTPALAVGQSVVLYPITYISVLISNLILGHYFGAIDVFVIIHLLIGALGVFALLRYFGAQPLVAMFGGITWSLSSFNIYVSNSWVLVSAVAAYFPITLLYAIKLYKSPSEKNFCGLVLTHVLFFYAGHIQYFVYSVIFQLITLILFLVVDRNALRENKKGLLQFIKYYTVGYIFILILTLPLLLPMWHQTTISAMRNEPLPFEMFVDQCFSIDQLGLAFILFLPTQTVRKLMLLPDRELLDIMAIS